MMCVAIMGLEIAGRDINANAIPFPGVARNFQNLYIYSPGPSGLLHHLKTSSWPN